MGNTVTLLNEKACEGVLNIERPLNEQIIDMGVASNAYMGKIHLWKMHDDKFNKPKIFSKTFYNTQTDSDEYKNLHIRRATMNHPNILKYFGCTQIDRYKLCSNVSETQWFFEYECLLHSLHNVMQYHRANYSNIKENKVWKIIGQVISALAFLEKRNEFHSDISANHIFIDRYHNIKIAEHGLLNQSTAYTQCLVYNEKRFLSPQLMSEYCQRSLHPVHDVHKSDIYAFGMTILELLTLDDSSECYNFQLGKINYYLIAQNITKVKELGYSTQLVDLLEKMLTQEEETRPSAVEIDESGLVDFQNISLLNQTMITQKNLTPQKDRENKPNNNHLTQSTQTVFTTPQPIQRSQVQMMTPQIPLSQYSYDIQQRTPQTYPREQQQMIVNPTIQVSPFVQYRVNNNQQQQYPVIMHSPQPQRVQLLPQFQRVDQVYQASPTRSRYQLFQAPQQQIDYKQ